MQRRDQLGNTSIAGRLQATPHVSDDFVATGGLQPTLKKPPTNLITACEPVDSKLWVTPAFLEQ
jgi:hypothetical protein